MEVEAVEGADASSVETDVVTEDPTEGGQVEGGETEVSEGSPQTYTVKVGDEEVEVSLDDALKGYMRQADYTRKTQELAQQREELSYGDRVARALQSDPESAIKALEEAYGLNRASTPAADVEDDEDLDPTERRVREIDRWIEEQESRSFEAHVHTNLERLHGQYGEFEDAKFIDFMVERGIPDFDDAAKLFVYDSLMQQAQRQQKEDAAQQRKETAPPVAGGTTTAAGAVAEGGAAPFRSVRAAFEAAMRQHGG